MGAYDSIYRAKAVQYQAPFLTVYVPQIFGDVSIQVRDFITSPDSGMGWVLFQGGDPAFPVWLGGLGSGGGGGGTVTDTLWVGPNAPSDKSIEIWYDTDEAPADYVNVAGDTMTGNLNMAGKAILNLPDPATSGEPVPYSWAENRYVNIWGDTMTNRLTLSDDPINSMHAATKQYVDRRRVCQVTMSAAQSITSSDLAAIVLFNTEALDPHGWHSTSTNTDRITPTFAGWYRATVTFQWSGDSDYTRRLVDVYKNGALLPDPSPRFEEYALQAAGATPQNTLVSQLIQMNGTTDYLTVRVYQVNTNAGANTIRVAFCVELVYE